MLSSFTLHMARKTVSTTTVTAMVSFNRGSCLRSVPLLVSVMGASARWKSGKPKASPRQIRSPS
jgi:hypothetical protein